MTKGASVRRLLLSRQQERKGMARFGGSQNSRSGAGWSRKNDGRTSDELIEFKRTDNRRAIRILADDLNSLYNHAVAECRRPVLGFELCGKHWVILPESSYHELVLHRPPADPTGDLRAGGSDRLARSRKMPGATGGLVLQRPPAQQQPGAGGPKRVPGNPPSAPRSLPRPGGLSGLRDRERRKMGSLGRNQRKGAPSPGTGQTPTAS